VASKIKRLDKDLAEINKAEPALYHLPLIYFTGALKIELHSMKDLGKEDFDHMATEIATQTPHIYFDQLEVMKSANVNNFKSRTNKALIAICEAYPFDPNTSLSPTEGSHAESPIDFRAKKGYRQEFQDVLKKIESKFAKDPDLKKFEKHDQIKEIIEKLLELDNEDSIVMFDDLQNICTQAIEKLKISEKNSFFFQLKRLASNDRSKDFENLYRYAAVIQLMCLADSSILQMISSEKGSAPLINLLDQRNFRAITLMKDTQAAITMWKEPFTAIAGSSVPKDVDGRLPHKFVRTKSFGSSPTEGNLLHEAVRSISIQDFSEVPEEVADMPGIHLPRVRAHTMIPRPAIAPRTTRPGITPSTFEIARPGAQPSDSWVVEDPLTLTDAEQKKRRIFGFWKDDSKIN